MESSETDEMFNNIYSTRMPDDVLRQYEETNAMLSSQFQNLQDSHMFLKEEMGNLVSENERLRAELRDVYSSEMDADQLSSCDNEIIKNLKQQLAISLKENEDIMKLWQMAFSEIEKYEKIGIQSSSNVKSDFGNNAQEALLDYIERIKFLESKLHSIKNHSRKNSVQLDLQKQAAEKVSDQNKSLKIENNKLAEIKSSYSESLDELQRKLCKVLEENKFKDFQLTSMTKDLSEAKQHNELLMKQYKSLKSNLEEIEKSESISVGKIKEYSEIAEAALFEKESAIGREKLALSKISRLENSLQQIMNNAGRKAKVEVEKIKIQYNNNLEQLINQIQQLEMELSSCKIQNENLAKEKEYLITSINKNKEKNVTNFSDHEKLLMILRERDEAHLEVDKLKNTVKFINKKYEKEAQNVKNNFNEIRNHLAIKMNDLQRLSEERIEFVKQIEGLLDKLKTSEEGSYKMKIKYEKQVCGLKDEMKLLEEKNQIKLDTINESQVAFKDNIQSQFRLHHSTIVKLKEEISTYQRKEDLNKNSIHMETEKYLKKNALLIEEIESLKNNLLKKEKKLKYYEDEFLKMDKRLKITEEMMSVNKATPSNIY